MATTAGCPAPRLSGPAGRARQRPRTYQACRAGPAHHPQSLEIQPVDIAAVVDRAQVMQVPHDERIEASDLRGLLYAQREHVLDRRGRGVRLGLVGVGVMPVEVRELLVGLELEQ